MARSPAAYGVLPFTASQRELEVIGKDTCRIDPDLPGRRRGRHGAQALYGLAGQLKTEPSGPVRRAPPAALAWQ